MSKRDTIRNKKLSNNRQKRSSEWNPDNQHFFNSKDVENGKELPQTESLFWAKFYIHWFLTTFCRVLLFPFFRCRKLSFWKVVQHAREHPTRKWASCGLKQLVIWMISCFFLIHFIIGYCWWGKNAFIFCKLTLLTNLWIILLIIIIFWLLFFSSWRIILSANNDGFLSFSPDQYTSFFFFLFSIGQDTSYFVKY